MTVYVDVLFGVNFIIDTLLIYATAFIARSEIHIARILASAAGAAIYSVIMFFPNMSFIFGGALKFIFSVILIMFAFKTYRIKRIIKLVFIFYMMTFIFGGAVFGVFFLTNSGQKFGAMLSNGELYLNLNVGILIALSVLIYLGILCLTKIFRRNYSRDRVLKKVRLKAFGEQINVTALLDTGCELCDPITNKAAMIIESSVLPKRVLDTLYNDTADKLYEISNELDAEAFKCGVRYLPFSSIGCEKGFIKAFVAEEIELVDDEYYISDKPSVGIVEFSLTEDGLYSAIINPDMLEKREENKSGYVKRISKFFKDKGLFF